MAPSAFAVTELSPISDILPQCSCTLQCCHDCCVNNDCIRAYCSDACRSCAATALTQQLCALLQYVTLNHLHVISSGTCSKWLHAMSNALRRGVIGRAA